MAAAAGHLNESHELAFTLHGVQHTVDTKGLRPETTLNEYLRDRLHLTGTKYMCREGGCGVCIVAVTAKHPRTGVRETFAVNSCLVSILSCGGWEVTTIEGLGNRHDGYHPIQRRLVQFNGTQCGFCTPGMVMNMHALMEAGRTSMAAIENAFGGNMCRCTGYRPILAAFKAMASDADAKLLGAVPDIEELRLCAKERCARTCAPQPRGGAIATPLVYSLQAGGAPTPSNRNWYKVASVADIFGIWAARSGEDYKLVAGNTARGVYGDMDRASYYIDVSGVAALRGYSHNTDKLVLGGNLTIAEMMDAFVEVGTDDDAFKHLLTAAAHLDLVATVPVRNIGTIGGNLFMKYQHNEFPSDIFLLLEAMKAKLVLLGGRGKEVIVSPQQFLTQRMFNRLIVRVEIPPLDARYRFESYKIMPRAQNAHAHVSAAFLFRLRDGGDVVEEAAICYGGIHPAFVHAAAAEALLVGKRLFDGATMQALFAQLSDELVPDDAPPDPSPEYRKAVAIALAYKAILAMAPAALVAPARRSGGARLTRPAVSHGTQDYRTSASMYPIGKPVDKYEAAEQAAGETQYVMDMPDAPNQLYAAFVMARAAAGATVAAIDAGRALALVDVEGFFQASDVAALGGRNTFITPFSVYEEEEVLFVPVGGRVQYYYQPLGVVVAKTQRLAEEAAELVEVVYVAPAARPLLTVRDVLRSHEAAARVTHDQTLLPKRQDLSVPLKFAGSFDVGWQYHYHMEDQCVSVHPDEDGRFHIYAATQWMDAVQTCVAGALRIPAHKLSVQVRRCGGAYGAKISRACWPACAATLAAMRLRRPVKLWLPLQHNMNIMGGRHPLAGDYEVGCDAAGRIGYLNHTLYHDIGLHANELPRDALLDLLLSTYDPAPVQVDYNFVRTDMHAGVYTRAPGSTEGLAVVEAVMEHISCALGKDPVDVRMANLNVERHPLLAQLMAEFLRWSEFKARRAAIERFNSENRWRKRGIAIVPMVYNLAFAGNFHAQVSIYQADGTVGISHGGIEVGQGIHTKAVQVVAYYLGIDESLISVYPSNNFTAANCVGTGGSQTSEGICFAFRKACEALKQRIDDAAAKAKLPPEAAWTERVRNAYNMGVELISNQMWINDPADSAAYPIYGLAASEVEVDVLTGGLLTRRVDLLEDVGDSISPIIDVGQCEGAFVMGLGYWTSEEVRFAADGRKLTNRTWTYKPPGCRDIPVDFRVRFPEGNPNPRSPFRTKATGEPPLCLAFSVALAIRHAIRTARTQADPEADPWVPVNGPCTVEWNFLNCLNDYKQYEL